MKYIICRGHVQVCVVTKKPTVGFGSMASNVIKLTYDELD